MSSSASFACALCWLSLTSTALPILSPEVVKSWAELSIKTEELKAGSVVSYEIPSEFTMPGIHEIFQGISIDGNVKVTLTGVGEPVLDAQFRNTVRYLPNFSFCADPVDFTQSQSPVLRCGRGADFARNSLP